MNAILVGALLATVVPPQAPPVRSADCGCKDDCGCKPCKCAKPATREAAVLVRWVDNPAGYAASGTCLRCENGKSLVVTNRHLFRYGEGDAAPYARPGVAVVVESEDGKSLRGRLVLITSNGEPDLAACVVEGVLPAAKLAAAEPAPGSEVRQWGRAARAFQPSRPVFKVGRVIPPRETDFLSTIPMESGDSGCGVFAGDELVSVGWGGSREIGQWGCRLSQLKEFLGRVPKFASPVATAADVPTPAKSAWVGDYAEGFGLARDAKKPCLVMVGGEDCVLCKKLMAAVDRDTRLKADLTGHVLVKLDPEKYPSVAASPTYRWAVRYPTLLLFDESGRLVRVAERPSTADEVRAFVFPPPAAAAPPGMVWPQPAPAGRPIYQRGPRGRGRVRRLKVKLRPGRGGEALW